MQTPSRTPKLFRCSYCGTFVNIVQMRQHPWCRKCHERLSEAVPAGLYPPRRPDPRLHYQLPFWQVVRLYWRRRVNRRRYARRGSV